MLVEVMRRSRPLISRWLVPPAVGMGMGLVAGLALSLLYAVIVVGAELVRGILNGFGGATLMVAVLAPTLLILAAVFLGIVPATAFGMATGALLGLLQAILKSRVTCTQFTVIGFLTCAGISIGVHVLFEIPPELGIAVEELGILGSYPFLVGIPSIVYIVAGTMVSFFLCRLVNRMRSRSNNGSVSPT